MTLFLVLNCNCNYASSKFCTFCFIKRSFAKKEIPTNISILFPTRHHYFSCCTMLISGLIDPEISTTSRVERGQCFQIQDLFTCPRLARHLQLGIHSQYVIVRVREWFADYCLEFIFTILFQIRYFNEIVNNLDIHTSKSNGLTTNGRIYKSSGIFH